MSSLIMIVWLASLVPMSNASHQGDKHHGVEESPDVTGPIYSIPGASFQVVLSRKTGSAGSGSDGTLADAAVQTVIDAFTIMLEHRTDYPRFDESLKKDALQQVIIEPTVVNQDGKEFSFLVARTKDQGRVKLLISASSLKDKGYLRHPDQLVPVLAREFQWVVSKADTAPKSKAVLSGRDVKHAPIRMNHEIQNMTGDQRADAIQRLFETYLTTVDDQKSLEGQPFYEVGTTKLTQPAQSDSTTKLYDIRVREALQKIMKEPYFFEHTPKAVRSLLNGNIWNVSFVKIDQRDWATRTRVLPEDKSVLVGELDHRIQPAKILVNTYRTAAPDDPFYMDTNGLPMGALSADQLARVIASEIEQNITEKSMRGHVVQDQMTAPR
ncbi:MAG TPA: hypothetical protein VJV04_16925 [Nitrospiraceae bacterium]|nr:hypothetical protein [Nitrospiraceae bacterium]